MGTTVIDALVVTLGLDRKSFEKGQKQTDDDLKKTRSEAEKTAKELEQRGKEAAQFFTKMRNEALAFFATVAIGAGLKSFVSDTVNLGSSLGRTADNLKMTTERLNAYMQAAEYAGGSQQGMIAQLKQSADDVARFKMGLSSDSMQWFFRMGGSTDALKDGNSYLLARADIVKKLFDVDPTRAAVVAQSMGISDDQFNLIKQGSGAILELVAAREKLSKFSDDDAKGLDNLRKKWLDFRNSLEYTATKILIRIEPLLEAGLKKFQEWADWAVAHKDDIKKFISEAVAWLLQFLHMVDDAAKSVGGWKNVLIALLALKVLSFTANLVGMAAGLSQVAGSLTALGTAGAIALRILGPLMLLLHSDNLNEGEQGNLDRARANPLPAGVQGNHGYISREDRRKYLFARMKQDGYTDAQIAGVMGSLIQESGLDPTATNDKTGAYGIAQWLSKSRTKAFSDAYGHDIKQSTYSEQVEFMLQELRTSEKRAGDLIRRAPNAEMAAQLHAWEYERPGVNEANIPMRLKYAQGILAQYGGGMSGAADVPPGGRVATSGAGGNTVSNEVNISKLEIYTQANDAAGIAQSLPDALSRYNAASQLNTGMN